MLGFLLGLILGLFVGGLATRFWIRKRLIPLPIDGADFRLLCDGEVIYEGDDLTLVKDLRATYKRKGADVHLWVHGVDRR